MLVVRAIHSAVSQFLKLPCKITTDVFLLPLINSSNKGGLLEFTSVQLKHKKVEKQKKATFDVWRSCQVQKLLNVDNFEVKFS